MVTLSATVIRMTHLLKVLILSGLATLSPLLWAQESARVFDNEGQLLFSYQDDQILSRDNEVLFTLSGNIVFYGDSREKEDFAYLIREKDVFDKRLGYIYDATGANVLFSVHKGNFYFGTGRFNDQLLLEMDFSNSMRVLMVDGQEDDTIGYSIASSLTGQAWCAIFLTWMESGKVGERLRLEQELEEQARTGDDIVGRMKLEWDSGFYYEWEWDGKRIRPRWGNRPEDEWVFDGETLMPYWGNSVQDEWEWDGQYLKPAWGEVPELTFIWDSSSFRPFWEYREDMDWVIEESLAYPKWDRSYEREWTIEGTIPVPVIAIVVLGIADR